MISLSFSEIAERINSLELPVFDVVVGIAEGGIVPASLLAYKTGLDLTIIKLNYRDISNKPLFEQPQILSVPGKNFEGKKILLVDDVSVTGKTLKTAAEIFHGNSVTTLALKGKADYVLFPEVGECVQWPWKADQKGEGV